MGVFTGWGLGGGSLSGKPTMHEIDFAYTQIDPKKIDFANRTYEGRPFFQLLPVEKKHLGWVIFDMVRKNNDATFKDPNVPKDVHDYLAGKEDVKPPGPGGTGRTDARVHVLSGGLQRR